MSSAVFFRYSVFCDITRITNCDGQLGRDRRTDRQTDASPLGWSLFVTFWNFYLSVSYP